MGIIRDTILQLGPAQRFDYWWRAQMKMFHKGEPEFKILQHIVDPHRNSVDVGAWKGIYSSWLQKYSKHVYAYEPNPITFRFLNYAKGNVTATNCAISNKAGTATLRIEKVPGHKPRKSGRGEDFWYDDMGGSLRADKFGDGYKEMQVETRRLDDENLENVGFMKIDVEGHEFEVLEGARQTIESSRPVMLIEIEERHNRKPIAEALAEIESLGYTGFAYTPHGLKSLAMFDSAKHCNPKDYEQYYIYNFIFFPR